MNFALLFIGALLGFLSVLLAAYTDHTLTLTLDTKSLNAVLTAVRYQQFYALVICMLAFLSPLQIDKKIKKVLRFAAYVFIIGIVFFSGSIYLVFIYQLSKLIYLTPIGGSLLLIGWLFLIRAAFFRVQHKIQW